MESIDQHFPKRRISAGAIIRDGSGALLIVKPKYRDGWLLPGGIVESGETPAEGLRRETKEEVGIVARLTRLICVDCMPATSIFGESIHFLFECDNLNAEEAASVHIRDDELSGFRFCYIKEAAALLAPPLADRLSYIAGPSPRYLEGGRDPWVN